MALRGSAGRLSPTDQHARAIAEAFAKGRMARFTPALDLYFAGASREVFAAFEGVVRHMPTVEKDEALIFGYAFLLKGLLEHLRYSSDRGYAEPAALIQEFQSAVTAQAAQMDRQVLSCVTGALQQAGIPASPELAAAVAARFAEESEGEAASLGALDETIADMVAACDGDPFSVVASIAEAGHAMPAEVRVALPAFLARTDRPDARAAAVLFLLDANPATRFATAEALLEAGPVLSVTDVRRLIAMRNWRPESERPAIDAIVRKARAAGVDCASWEAGQVELVLASMVDGTCSQGFVVLSPAGRRKWRLSSILTKVGIADAWSGESETRKRIEASLRGAGMDTPTLPVSRAYLDRCVAHHLALCIENGRTPPPGLLQVAETIGGVDWQPSPMAFDDALAMLMSEIPAKMRAAAAVKAILRRSDKLEDLLLVAQSWFDDDPEIARAVAASRGAPQAKRVEHLLQTVMVRRRHKWAEVFLRAAAWLHDVSEGGDASWRELALVARAVAEGWDLGSIGLMRDVASRTIMVLDDSVRPSNS